MIRLLLLLAILCAPVAARSETLIAAMSAHQIQINSNYTGSQLTVFGMIERDGRSVARGTPYDIVVTVRGPRRMLLVREKEKLGPIWINRTQRRFPDSPLFLSISSSRPLSEMMEPDVARRERIGLANSERVRGAVFELDGENARFRDNMIRILQAKELYGYDRRGVTFLSQNLFSAPIDVPATAPTGPYEIEIVLFSGSVPLARQTTSFEVVKTGLEQSLASGAHEQPVLYGLITVLFALMLGWLAAVVFRRD